MSGNGCWFKMAHCAISRTLSLITVDTLEDAQFPRERLGPAFERLLALGWALEAPEIYEATIYETFP